MTQEQKAKAYDKVVNKLKRFIAQGVDPLITRADVQDFFSELKESEDEKMKNWILDELRLSYQWAAGDRDRCEELLKAIAWLEKQGKSKWTEEDDTIRCEIIRRMEALDHYWNRPNDQKLIDWLKSLKQRMEEQQ